MRPLTLLFTTTLVAISLACGGDPSADVLVPAAEPASAPSAAPVAAGVQDGTAQGVTATTTVDPSTGQVTAAVGASSQDKPSTPAASGGTGEYPGTWTGVCQRLDDCGCNPMASVPACARTAETSYADGMAMARSMRRTDRSWSLRATMQAAASN